jgi:hypothetical protein
VPKKEKVFSGVKADATKDSSTKGDFYEMKLMVWQQFSSNHSNGFTLVGIFPSVVKAEKAFKRIEKLLNEIDKWREEHPDDYRYERMTAPEEKIAGKYNIDWPEPTENVSVQQFQAIVEIDAPGDSWTRRAPYEQLLQIFGANVAGWDGEDQGDEVSEASIFRAKITAKAKSEDEAASLATSLEETLKAENERKFQIFKKASVSSDGLEITIGSLSLREIQFFGSLVQELEAACGNVEYAFQKEVLGEGEK